jgi:hypothetical protein
MKVQSAVERSHQNRRRDPNGLAATVNEAWENLPGDTIEKVFLLNAVEIISTSRSRGVITTWLLMLLRSDSSSPQQKL